MYRGSWPTRDGVIPWKLFALYSEAIGPALLAEQLQDTRAVAHGIALSLSGNEPKVKAATDKLIKQAYPEGE